MKRAIIVCLLLILALGLVACESVPAARCCSTTSPRPLRSTVFNTPLHQELAQLSGTASTPANQTWYYARRDATPAVITGYVTGQSEQRVTVTRNRNSTQNEDYNQTTYSRRTQTVTW